MKTRLVRRSPNLNLQCRCTDIPLKDDCTPDQCSAWFPRHSIYPIIELLYVSHSQHLFENYYKMLSLMATNNLNYRSVMDAVRSDYRSMHAVSHCFEGWLCAIQFPWFSFTSIDLGDMEYLEVMWIMQLKGETIDVASIARKGCIRPGSPAVLGHKGSMISKGAPLSLYLSPSSL